MFELVFKYTGKHKIAAILTPILMILEVLFDVLIPYVMSRIIDVGVNGLAGADINYIIKMGLVMVGLSMCAMICGGLQAILAQLLRICLQYKKCYVQKLIVIHLLILRSSSAFFSY